MATRFYLSAVGGPAGNPGLPTGWFQGTVAPIIGAATPGTPVAIGGIPTVGRIENTVNVRNIELGLFISPPLTAQTVSGNLTAAIRCSESNTTGDLSLQLGLYIIDSAGSSILSTLYAGHSAAVNATVGALGEEMSTSLATRIFPSTALSSQSASAGNRLMIIVGFRAHNTSASNFTGSIAYGDSQGSDYALTSGLTTNLNPWVELDSNLTFSTEARLDRAAVDVLIRPDPIAQLGREAVDVLYRKQPDHAGWGQRI